MNCSRVINILNRCIIIRIHYLVRSSLEVIIRNLILLCLFTFINNLVVTNIVHVQLDRNWKRNRFFFFQFLEVFGYLLVGDFLPLLPDFLNLLLCYAITSFYFICCKSFIFGQKKVVG